MGFDTVTELRCSDPEILKSGSTFNAENKDNLLGFKNDVVAYFSRKYYFIDTIKELSSLHPNVSFTGSTWRTDEIEECYDYITVYRNGEEIVWDIKTHYNFLSQVGFSNDKEIQAIEPMIQKHVLKYFARLDRIDESALETNNFLDILNDKKDGSGFSSFYYITLQNEKYNVYATRRNVSWVQVYYEKLDALTDVPDVKEKLLYKLSLLSD